MKYLPYQKRNSDIVKLLFALSLVPIAWPNRSLQSQESLDSTAMQGKHDPDPVLEDAIKTLEIHQVQVTPNGIRNRLQRLDPSHPSNKKLENRAIVFVQNLNSTDYLVRETATQSLKRMATVPTLQLAAAAKSKNPEVAYRARVILDYVGSRNRRDTEQGIIESACIVIKAKQIKGMTNVLLDVLMLVEDPVTQATVGDALVATVENSDVDTLRSGMRSEHPQQRIASSIALLELLGPVAVKELQQCLKTELNDRVRVALVRSLANQGDRETLPVLIELLDSDELKVRVESGQILRALTAQRFEFVAYESKEKRKESVKKWQSWLRDHGDAVELQFPILEKQLAVGRILYADYKLNKAVEVDMNGKEVWSVDVKSAWNVQGLPNGHRLVSDYAGRTVVEFDRKGNEVWKLTRAPKEMMGLHRLENGNTLVGSGTKVIEYNPDGTAIWEKDLGGRVGQCQRLANGNTVVALFDKNSVVEINPQGKSVWSIQTGQNPMAVHRTSAGTTLIGALSDPIVKEYDQENRVVWNFKANNGITAVRRLPNGDTLINSKTEIQLVSPDKKVRWSIEGLRHSFGLWAY